MDFARKQLEKYGWTEGSGLGKIGNAGISAAIKPSYKTGKEGLGFDLSKDLVDTWWTRAYSDSLKRLKVSDSPTHNKNEHNSDDDGGHEVIVSVNDEDDGGSTTGTNEMTKMRRRMYKSNFTDFSKGATLANGELVDENQDSSSTDSGISTPTSSKELKLTDDELFKACGGRTAHKAARFGHKLSGKLARLAAQEAEEIRNLASNSKQCLDLEICDIADADAPPLEKRKKKRRKEVEDEEFLKIDSDVKIPSKKSKRSKNVTFAELEVEILPKKKSKRRKNSEDSEMPAIPENEIPLKKKSKRKRELVRSDSEIIS